MKHSNLWFKFKGWTPWPFQKEAWKSIAKGEEGIVSVPTGAGKTYAAYFGFLDQIEKGQGLQLLYITPLKALARDLELALAEPAMMTGLRVESRTGDTATSKKAKQRAKPPEILLTTPESLSLLLSYPEAEKYFSSLKGVIVDEWHELMGSKRGALLELSLRRLRTFSPAVITWGLTATLANLGEAAQVLVGQDRPYKLIQSSLQREVIIDILKPPTLEKMPFAGHFGMSMAPYVAEILDPDISTLIFTNTRSAAEKWYQELISLKPEWKKLFALHHSSIDRKDREKIEQGIKEGVIKFVVCTSSLDLGVDFSPVEAVIQIGTPKSVARLMQRAGRASHRPMQPCKITLVPTYALQLFECEALKEAVLARKIEARVPLTQCYDVILQHLTTLACAGGFNDDQVFNELQSTHMAKDLTREIFDALIRQLVHGGESLSAYPDYHKLVLEEGLYKIRDKRLAVRHRMMIGTIPTSTSVAIKMLSGRSVGVVEEEFISRFEKGDVFSFGGKILELVVLKDLVASVRTSKKETNVVAVWQGSKLPWSQSLSEQMRKVFHRTDDPFLNQLMRFQSNVSALPKENECLIEQFRTREGWHLFFYPFEGKTVHEGLAALFAYRLSKEIKATITTSANDWGFELFSNTPLNFKPELLDIEDLEYDLEACMNETELAKRSFRDIARIAGLIYTGYPGQGRPMRHLQANTSTIFDVFTTFEPDHLLLEQAHRQAKEEVLQEEKIKATLLRLQDCKWIITHPARMTPFSLPLYIERASAKVTSETLLERIEKIKKSWK